jgi:hypothetical protein
MAMECMGTVKLEKDCNMKSALPITALSALIVLGMHVGEGFKKSLDDGKLTLTDLPNFIPVFPYVGPAFENIAEVPKQFADIDTDEAAELKAEILKAVGEVIDQERLVAQIDASLNWIHSTYVLVKSFKA